MLKPLEWIDDVIGAEAERGEVNDRRRQQEVEINKINSLIDVMKDELKSGHTYEVTKKGIFFDKKLVSMAKFPDPSQEIDTWHDLPGTEGLSEDDRQRYMAAVIKVQTLYKELAGKLKEPKTPVKEPERNEDGTPKLDKNGEPILKDKLNDKGEPVYEPLFSDQDLRNEFWTPLVREGVIPENSVPDAFSERRLLFEESMKLYEKRMAEESKKAKNNGEALEWLDTSSELVNQASEVATNIVSAIPELKGAEHIKDIVSGVQLTICAGTAIAKGVLENEADGAIKAISSALSTDLADWKPIGSYIADGFSASANAVLVGKHLAAGEYDQALSCLSSSLSSGFTVGADVFSGKSDEEKALNSLFTSISTNLKSAFAGTKVLKQVVTAFQAKPPDVAGAISAIVDGAKKVVSRELGELYDKKLEVATEEAKEKGETVSDEETSKLKHEKSEAKTSAGDAIKAFSKVVQEWKSNGEDKEKEKEAKEAQAKLKEKADMEKLDMAGETFKAMLEMGFPMQGATEADFQKFQADFDIDAVIKQMELDQRIIGTFEKLLGAGLKTAAEFVPALKAVSASKEFVFNLIAALKRWEERYKFAQRLKDATAGVSAVSPTIKNFIKNAEVQASKKTVQAALCLAEAIGASASCTGIGAAVGVALEKGAAAAKAGSEIIYTIEEKARMHRAWSILKSALNTPQDRKLAAEAMELNPTLAKYGIAYGALELQDPTAKRMLNDCGLNNRVLSNPTSNVDRVSKYLEKRFNEDPVLLETAPPPEKWFPTAEPLLTLNDWVKFVAKARREEVKPNDKLGKANEGLVEKSLVKLDAKKTDYEKKIADNAWPKMSSEEIAKFFDEWITTLNELEKSLNSYKPVDEKQVEHKGMAVYCQTLLVKCRQERVSVKNLQSDAEELLSEALIKSIDLAKKEGEPVEDFLKRSSELIDTDK